MGGLVTGGGVIMLAPVSPFFRQTLARLTGRRALWVLGIATWLSLLRISALQSINLTFSGRRLPHQLPQPPEYLGNVRS
jgi:hypothetical protein